MPSTVIEPTEPEPLPDGPLDAERVSRRPGFSEGWRVRLADGQYWTLPLRKLDQADLKYDALVAAVHQAEDRREALFAGHVLTIFLLDRNYALQPDDLSVLLTFPQGDPALVELQRVVWELALAGGQDGGGGGSQ